jgi:SH3 domain-containing YSC84-like protein 1
MKRFILGCLLLGVGAGLANSAPALDKAELDRRIRTLTTQFEAMQAKTEKTIPAETLGRAEGIVLLDRTKAGFVLAYQGGSGTALLRDEKTGKWGPAAFVSANEASLGLQIGGQQSFVVILLMTTNATRLLTEPSFEFVGEARGIVQYASLGTLAAVSPAPKSQPPVLIYDDRKGLYGGAALKGGAMAPDDQANRVYYGQSFNMKEILTGSAVSVSEAAAELNMVLEKHARVEEKKVARK